MAENFAHGLPLTSGGFTCRRGADETNYEDTKFLLTPKTVGKVTPPLA